MLILIGISVIVWLVATTLANRYFDITFKPFEEVLYSTAISFFCLMTVIAIDIIIAMSLGWMSWD